MTKQIRDYVLEARQIRESKTIDDISTKELGAFIKTLNVNLDKVNPKWLADKIKIKFGLKYTPTSIEINEILDNMPKEYVESIAQDTTKRQKNEGLGPYSEVEKQLEKFKKYMYQNYKNHPGFDSERKEAIETVLDLLRELNEG